MGTNSFFKIAALTALTGFALLSLGGCGVTNRAADEANPFSAGGTTYGDRNNNAILGAGGGGGVGEARKALEAMATYRRAREPQPYYPAMNPAEVRLMWIPDHQTLDGNLVPAHYYYLKVMHDNWALQDAFAIEGQLEGGGQTGASYGTNGGVGDTPWVYKNK